MARVLAALELELTTKAIVLPTLSDLQRMNREDI